MARSFVVHIHESDFPRAGSALRKRPLRTNALADRRLLGKPRLLEQQGGQNPHQHAVTHDILQDRRQSGENGLRQKT